MGKVSGCFNNENAIGKVSCIFRLDQKISRELNSDTDEEEDDDEDDRQETKPRLC